MIARSCAVPSVRHGQSLKGCSQEKAQSSIMMKRLSSMVVVV